MKDIKIDMSSWWYKNCKKQRINKAKICDSCPFRKIIEEKEIINKDARRCFSWKNIR